MSWGSIVVGGASTIIGGIQAGKNKRQAEDIANQALLDQQEQQAALERQKAE